MKDRLKTIIQYKFTELDQLKKRYGPLKQIPFDRPRFRQNISRTGRVKIIAELKPSSPSEGVLFKPLKKNLKQIISLYGQFPLGAISVLTDERSFSGAYENLALVRELTDKPVLCKDFIVDEYQIRLAKYFGADALLLIAEALAFPRLRELDLFARSLGLDVLFELHDKVHLKTLIKEKVSIIGINNRDLATLKMDENKCYTLKALIPPDRIVVAESGLDRREQIRKLARHGFSAALIGTSLLRSGNMERKLQELVYYDESTTH